MRLRSGENAAFWNLTILSCGCPLAGLKDAERNSFPPIVRSIACRSSIILPARGLSLSHWP